VDQLAPTLRPAVQDESTDRLARFDKAAAGEIYEPIGMGGGGPPGMNRGVQPIKMFVVERNRSVAAQLAGTSKGADIDAPPAGMQRNFGPGNFLGPAFTAKFDQDKNGDLSRDEFVTGFSKWFSAWDKEKSGALDEEQLRTALDQEFAPPGGFGGGPRPDRPSE
jgi:hypothetical protein